MKLDHDVIYCTTGGVPNEVLLRQAPRDKKKAISRSEQMKRATKKFKKTHKTYTFHLETVQDADVIKWINKQGNKSEAVRRILRKAVIDHEQEM